MTAQYILTGIIILAAVAYAVRRIYVRLTHADRCEGCALSAHCRSRKRRRPTGH